MAINIIRVKTAFVGAHKVRIGKKEFEFNVGYYNIEFRAQPRDEILVWDSYYKEWNRDGEVRDYIHPLSNGYELRLFSKNEEAILRAKSERSRKENKNNKKSWW
jgi:hypothetical protein